MFHLTPKRYRDDCDIELEVPIKLEADQDCKEKKPTYTNIKIPRDEMNPNYYDWFSHTIQFADEFYKWRHGIVDDLGTTN